MMTMQITREDNRQVAKRFAENICYEMAYRMLDEMPECKAEVLCKALDRNLILTSCSVLSSGYLYTYKEGWLLKLEGTRCSFSVFAYDNDGELLFSRKPKESSLHLLYSKWLTFNECDYDRWKARRIAK